jgi:hypothetical protein
MKLLITLIVFVFPLLTSAQVRDLDYFISQARQTSPVLRDYEGQIQAASIDSQLLRASQQTQVNFLSTNSYAPVVRGWGYDPAITNIANVTAIVQANRNFLTRGNVATQFQSIALQRRALLDTMAISRNDIARTISDQYITAYGDLLAMDFNKEVYDLMKKEELALKKLTEASVYKQTDYLNFYVTMQQQELIYLQAEMLYRSDFLTLNYLAGIVDTTIIRIERPSLSDSLSTGFFQSVFYNRFITDSLRIANERSLIAFEYQPKLGAYTDAGYNSSLQFQPYRNFGFSLGVSLSIPIYDGRQKQMKYAKADIRERTRQANRDYFINQYRQQVAQLQQQLAATDLMVGRINKQIVFAHALIEANGKLLQTGDITMKDYVTAINNYLVAQNLLTQNSISRLRIVSQINYWNTNR